MSCGVWPHTAHPLTNPNLARGIGEALHRACSRKLQLHYAEEGEIFQFKWTR